MYNNKYLNKRVKIRINNNLKKENALYVFQVFQVIIKGNK